LHGSSLLPIFEGKQREEPEFFLSGLNKFRMFRMGEWKIVRLNNEDNWELYNMIDDPAETNDLSGQYPEKVEELLTAYQQTPFYGK
jgi:arylsulfatase A-like enzyme